MLIPAAAPQSVEPMMMIEPPLDIRGQPIGCEQHALRFLPIIVSNCSSVISRGAREHRRRRWPRHVKAPNRAFTSLSSASIAVGLPRPLERPSLLPDRRDGVIEPPLIASRHDDGSALFHELLCDREPIPACHRDTATFPLSE